MELSAVPKNTAMPYDFSILATMVLKGFGGVGRCRGTSVD